MRTLSFPVTARRTDGLFTVVLESASLAIATLGAIHLAFLCLFDFDLITEALGARPLTASVVETIMVMSALYSLWVVHRHHDR